MGSNTLSYKESITYLGLILDSKLTWDLQLKKPKRKSQNTAQFLVRLGIFYHKGRLELYNAFIYSRLNYGIEIYLNTTKSYTRKLFSIQNTSKFSSLNHFGQI